MQQRKLNQVRLIILISLFLKLSIHIIATCHSGYHGDELLHIEAGRHLSFGYMDFPPFIGFVSWIQNLFESDSIFIHHLFNYLNSLIITLLIGLITIKLGGGTVALLISQSAVIFSPGLAASQYLFLPTAFEQMFWLLTIYVLIEFSRTRNYKLLLIISTIAAIGFLNKYSIVFLLAGICISVLIIDREILSNKLSWVAVLIFLVIILPNLVWQLLHQFPIFHHMSELYKTQLDKQSIFTELFTTVISLNPLTFVLWIPLLAAPFLKRFKTVLLPLLTLSISFLLLILSKGKSYYFFPILLSIIPFGAVYVEHKVQSIRWIGFSYLSLLIAVGILILPFGVPILKIDDFTRIYNLKPNSDNKIPIVFENYYSTKNWNRILNSVKQTQNRLNINERKNCLVWGRHYSLAGGINLLGSKLQLPHAFSFHSSFYSWVPDFNKEITIIAISESNLEQEYWQQYFESVEEIDVIDNHFASDKNWYNYRVFLCKKIRYNSDELKRIFKDQIF